MLKSFSGKTKLCNIVCAVLTLCLLILQFTPFWNYGNGSLSINGYVWLDCGNTDIANWFSSQLGNTVNLNSIVITAVLVLLFGLAGIILCIMKSYNGVVAILPALTGISALYAFAFKPAFRLGSTWVIQLLLSIAILVFAVMAFVFGIKQSKQVETGKQALSQGEISARVAAIKALSADTVKKGDSQDSDANFYKLLTFLTDEVPECRIAAAETLGQTSRDVAFTNISHLMNTEKDPNVKKAMREALISIRENMRKEHSEKI